jgi:hypothetical protein
MLGYRNTESYGVLKMQVEWGEKKCLHYFGVWALLENAYIQDREKEDGKNL